jgi:hypothetical protein
VSGVPQIVCRSNSSISPEQARDARARAWAFAFQCWHEKQIDVSPAFEPNGHDGTTLVRSTKEVSHVKQGSHRPSEST